MKFFTAIVVLATLEAATATTMTGAAPLPNAVQALGTFVRWKELRSVLLLVVRSVQYTIHLNLTF